MVSKSKMVYELLAEEYPHARCGLNYGTPFQLLVSTILSAQATDKSVNKVTEELYSQYPDADSFLTLSQEEIEDKIRKIGLYKNKAKSIYNMVRELKEHFNGTVPKTMEELMSLSGVGRKTASVVLVEAFNIPQFPVDTHVFRVTRRIGIATSDTPDKVSDEIMKKLPKKYYHFMHHLLITHGREVCSAQNPKCEDCCLKAICNFYNKKDKKVDAMKK